MPPQPIRLLAVVVAKNAVGSSWRKTLGTREWSRVPDEEKAVVREGAVQLLLAGERPGGQGRGGREIHGGGTRAGDKRESRLRVLGL